MTLKFLIAAGIVTSLFGFVQAQAQKSVLIVTEDLPPLQIVKQGKLVDGLAYQKVKRIVASAEVNAEWMVAPWSRVYKIALTQPNVVIFSLVRTPQRENKFIWIGQLFLMDLFLVSLKSKEIKANTIEEAKQFIVASKRSDVVYDYLEAAGFITDQNMLVVKNTSDTYNVLLKGRADLVPANKAVLKAYCANNNCTLEDFNFNIPLPDMQQDFYLAASKGTDPQIIKALSDAYHYLETKQESAIEDQK